ncbi:exo-alpha-sialidase, partial [Streptomyces sp. SID3212]|nr:exo-alpha-sialidase [Streptomyces sp. SID3212]
MRVRAFGARTRTGRRFLALLLSLAAGPAAVQVPSAAAASAPAACVPSVPYRSGQSGYFTFRIPAALQVPG